MSSIIQIRNMLKNTHVVICYRYKINILQNLS